MSGSEGRSRIGTTHDRTAAGGSPRARLRRSDVLSRAGIDVHLAKVATFDGRVVDAFYVRDELGRKLADPDRLRALDAALQERLA